MSQKIASKLVRETKTASYEPSHDATISIIAEHVNTDTNTERVYSCSSGHVPQVIADRIGELAEYIRKSGEDLGHVKFKVTLGTNPGYIHPLDQNKAEFGR